MPTIHQGTPNAGVLGVIEIFNTYWVTTALCCRLAGESASKIPPDDAEKDNIRKIPMNAVRPSASAWRNWRRTICDGPVLGSVMLRGASWSRSNSSWGTFRFKRRSATLGANSGFDLPSMIALASSRILEPGARLWKDCRRSAQELYVMTATTHQAWW